MFLAATYLIDRIFYRFAQFFVHWYGHSFYFIGGAGLRALERLDKLFALRITARNFWVPLYGDYSFLGRLLGIFFRSIRITVATVIYAFAGLIFLLAYIFWALIPVYFVVNAIYS